jgi:DNA-binding CsgD family transcriptional regulator
VTKPKKRKQRADLQVDRVKQVLEMRRRGMTYDQIGSALNPPITKQRVSQILVRWDISLTGRPNSPPPKKRQCVICNEPVGPKGRACRKHAQVARPDSSAKLVNFIKTVRSSRASGMTWREVALMMGASEAAAKGFMSRYQRKLEIARRHGFVQD